MEMKKCKKCKQDKPATPEYFYQKKGYYTSPCKACQQKKQKAYYRKNKPQPTNAAQKQKNYRTRNKKRLLKTKKSDHSNFRLRALWKYGGQPPSCKCCGTNNIRFLCLSNTKTRAITNSHRGFQKIIKANYPKGFEVMCHNCANSNLTYGECSHPQT
jgi:hypothetical protein